jgi:hypothetical protein
VHRIPPIAFQSRRIGKAYSCRIRGLDDIYRIRQAIDRVFAAMNRIHESASLANRPNDHAAGALDRTQEAIGGAFGPMDAS